MWRPLVGAGAVIGLALASLVLSKVVRDRGAAGYLPRRLASALGGLAFLAAVVFLEVKLALALLGAITAALVVLKLVVRRGPRRGRRQRSIQPLERGHFRSSRDGIAGGGVGIAGQQVDRAGTGGFYGLWR